MASELKPQEQVPLLRRLISERVYCPGTLAAIVALGFAVAAMLMILALPPNAERDSPGDDPVAVEQGLPTNDARMDGRLRTPAQAAPDRK